MNLTFDQFPKDKRILDLLYVSNYSCDGLAIAFLDRLIGASCRISTEFAVADLGSNSLWRHTPAGSQKRMGGNTIADRPASGFDCHMDAVQKARTQPAIS